MLLLYYRLYVTCTLLEFLFDIDETSVLQDIRILEPLVKECIPLPKKVYRRARRAASLYRIEALEAGRFEEVLTNVLRIVGKPR